MSNHCRRNYRRTGKAFQPDRTRLRKRGGFGASLLSSSKSPDQDHVMRSAAAGVLFLVALFVLFLLKRYIEAPNMLAVNRRQRLQLAMSGSLWTPVGLALASCYIHRPTNFGAAVHQKFIVHTFDSDKHRSCRLFAFCSG